MPNIWFEPLLYVVAEAWAIKTACDVEDWEYLSHIDHETGCNSERYTKQEPKQLTEVELAEKFEKDYERACSSVIHIYRRDYNTVVEYLEPYEQRLSRKFLKLLKQAREKRGDTKR